MAWTFYPQQLACLLLSTAPCNSKGNCFTTVQDAIDDLAGDGWVFVPAGTWSEALTITNNNVVLFGSGWGSIIDGGTTGHAISISGSYCTLRDLQAKTDQAGGTDFDAVSLSGDYIHVENVYVSSSDDVGFGLSSYCSAVNCLVANTDGDGIRAGPSCRVVGSRVKSIGRYGIYATSIGANSVFTGNSIDTTGDDGINIHADAENCVVDSNRIMSWTNEAIDDNSGTSVIGDNDTTV